MGKPAACLGDTTAHGGAIVLGFPMVLIGGKPAARVTDMHVCPMVTGLVPHVGGPIALGSMGVFIGGKPAARMGDMAICVGPPDSIVKGCQTVLIGDMASGAGGGGMGGSGTAGAIRSAAIAQQAPKEKKEEGHFIDMSFVDDASLPIGGVQYELTYPDNSKYTSYLSGRIRIAGVQPGNYTAKLRTIVNAQWSVKQADVGDTVDLKVETAGVKDGEKAKFDIYIRDCNYSDHLLKSLEETVNGDSVKAQWKLEVDDKFLGVCEEKAENQKYSTPFFFFRVQIAELFERSGLLFYKDWIEIKAVNAEGKPAANEEVLIYLSSGEIRREKLDSNGKLKIKKVFPSVCKVEFPNMPDAIIS